MLITVRCQVEAGNDEAITDPVQLAAMASFRDDRVCLTDSMSGELGELAMLDAGLSLAVRPDGKGLDAIVAFRARDRLTTEQIALLADYMRIQLLDGWFEDGFAIEVNGGSHHTVFVETAELSMDYDLTIEQVDDGVAVPDLRPTRLVKAADEGDHEGVLAAIAAGADLEATSRWGLTPLDLACHGYPETAMALLAAGAKPRQKAVHVAARDGYVVLLTALLDAGGPVDTPDQSDFVKGMTALHWSANRGHGATAALLISRGADVNAQDAHRRTPLMFARNAELAVLLLEAGADPELRDSSRLNAIGHFEYQAAANLRTNHQAGHDASMTVADAIRSWLKEQGRASPV